jgi:ornithine decarboxylase
MARNADAFRLGIENAHKLVHMAESVGFHPTLIDIGGGFSSTTLDDMSPVPSVINNAISNLNYKIIAEPGRYFAEHVATLVTPVIGVKGNGVTISDSLYGSFNCVLFDHAEPVPEFFTDGPRCEKTMFGSTCDGGDIILKKTLVPETLAIGDWVYWPRMGAYTSAATTAFNGIPFNARQVILI